MNLLHFKQCAPRSRRFKTIGSYAGPRSTFRCMFVTVFSVWSLHRFVLNSVRTISLYYPQTSSCEGFRWPSHTDEAKASSDAGSSCDHNASGEEGRHLFFKLEPGSAASRTFRVLVLGELRRRPRSRMTVCLRQMGFVMTRHPISSATQNS